MQTPEVNGQLALDGDQFLILCGIVGGAILLAWLSFLLVLRGHPETLRAVLMGGFVLRLVTISFIVGSASVLAAVRLATPEVYTILSGIAGFVLGGMNRREDQTGPADGTGSARP